MALRHIYFMLLPKIFVIEDIVLNSFLVTNLNTINNRVHNISVLDYTTATQNKNVVKNSV